MSTTGDGQPGHDPAAGSPPGGPHGPGAPGPPPARPALRRSTSDRMLFGIAGGLGRYLGVDPTLVRIAFVLLAVFGGSGLVLYLVALVAIPEEQAGGTPTATVRAGAPLRAPGNAVVVVGVVLIVIGGFALLRQVLPGIGTVAAPLVLLAAGILLLLAGRR